MMRTVIRKIGNSRGVLIPAVLLAECRIEKAVDLTVERDRIVITPVRALRAGWGEAAVAIAERNEDEVIWPTEFADEDDVEWVW